ncbi:polysaccharide biosynthesis/export family protein [Paracrocinitomix mangrovi]|uniref:polysaccharide biosynthesis/export family protein n=1 Tax=Paracrocinitomix mangrovi TaxID=2862509 RepID=UPI001C8EED5C|nr:polysaccharide biosynthesis/export family protein [Paracrocinitomix mangrovi]UKN02219.1 polysaccharide biosynthesis/export family protein [Paracrocinitomix mangrovi]
MINWARSIGFVGIILLIGSCGINSNWMLRTHKDYDFSDIDSLNESKNDYKIDINDILQLRFFTNDGIKVLDISSNATGNQSALFNPNNSLNYVIQNDSMVELPVVGQVNLVGMTIRQAELYLEDQFRGYYIDPFVQLSVTNRRVVVFPGNGGEAKVIYLQNNNTTLLEAIALAGGITERGRASKIKLIRKNAQGQREVYKIDLSTIEGLAYTDIIVQANDYIYVDPVPELGREVLKEVTPIVSLISSAAVIIATISALTP